MTDPRYAAPDVTDSAAAPERDPQGPSDDSPQGPSDGGSQGPSDGGSQGPSDTTVTSDHDPQATTELPRADWGSPSEAQSDAQPGTQSRTQAAEATWPSDQTQNFPAYRPQSYPTYPPTHSQTSELPAVGAGGPPPTTAAAYGGPGAGGPSPRAGAPGAPPGGGGAGPGGAQAMAIPAFAGMTAAAPQRSRRRAGAGLAGALGLIGLAAAAYGAFALPIQKLGPRRSPYFVSFRELSTQKVISSKANAHSVSFAGGHVATLWWRYGLAGALGVLALLLLVQLCVPVLRRAAGVLLFLGGLATIVGFAIGVHQTNDYRSVVGGIQGTHRIAVSQLGLGIWVPVAGCAVAAVGGLVAAVQSTRR